MEWRGTSRHIARRRRLIELRCRRFWKVDSLWVTREFYASIAPCMVIMQICAHRKKINLLVFNNLHRVKIRRRKVQSILKLNNHFSAKDQKLAYLLQLKTLCVRTRNRKSTKQAVNFPSKGKSCTASIWITSVNYHLLSKS